VHVQTRDVTRCAKEEATGYHSDGHGSGASSDNEATSVCSEMVGSAGRFMSLIKLNKSIQLYCCNFDLQLKTDGPMLLSNFVVFDG